MIKIYSDGATFGNKICIYDYQLKKSFIEYLDGKLSNNMLEYRALQKAIKYGKEKYEYEDVQIFSDSKLIVNQINGIYKTTHKDMFYECFKCKDDLKDSNIKIYWCPRKRNFAGQILQNIYDER